MMGIIICLCSCLDIVAVSQVYVFNPEHKPDSLAWFGFSGFVRGLVFFIRKRIKEVDVFPPTPITALHHPSCYSVTFRHHRHNHHHHHPHHTD
ncbi:hypothetical protein QVD17_11128 [Tagetes erecta]|uniref:Secreted protein n=1 Tax=Tagetes erecta TaxID=13708 RepID=A0AAD8P6J5_TARER|nr:hypothetical protein QVD17_11128 [Tagetes erecta]